MSEETKDQAAADAVETETVETESVETEAKPETAAAEAADESKTSVQQSDDEVALDADGRERPRFLLGFPKDPALMRLTAAFEAGNFALVRAEAPALAERAESRAVRDAALELRRRIDPDPLAKYLLALTAALLLFLVYFAYSH